MGKMFARPYFVTPHAVDRFRERIADIPPAQVIEVVQAMLQDPGLPVDAEMRDGKLTLIYRGEFGGKAVYLPVVQCDEPAEGRTWPVVVTVMSEESVLHGVLCRKDTKRGGGRRYDERKALIVPLREAGFTIRECAAILRIAHTTVERHIKRLGLAKRHPRKWRMQDVELLCRLRDKGVPYKEIAARLDRSEEAVRIKLCRLRSQYAETLADPNRRLILGILSFCLNPSRVLKAIRESGIYTELKRREMERRDLAL